MHSALIRVTKPCAPAFHTTDCVCSLSACGSGQMDCTKFSNASGRGSLGFTLFSHFCFDLLNLVSNFLRLSFEIGHMLSKPNSSRLVLLLIELIKIDLVRLDEIDEFLKSVHRDPFSGLFGIEGLIRQMCSSCVPAERMRLLPLSSFD